jgi:hypothetical protein
MSKTSGTYVSGFLGMRGTGDWSNEERPKSFREGMLYLYPNGRMPITGIMSKGRSERVTDPEFKWFSKNLAAQGGAVTQTYEDAALSNTFAAGEAGAVGDIVYAKCAEAVTNHFRIGHTAVLMDYSASPLWAFGKVIGKDANGASSYVAVKLRTAAAAGVLDGVNYIDIVGSSNPEGANIPEAISYDPDKYNGYTQIFRTPLNLTRTQRKTRMRTGDVYKEAKREAMLYHGIEMEMATVLGEASEVTGDNNKPERTTQGIISFVNEHNSSNVIYYPSTTGLTWKAGGEDWFDEKLEVLFRYGRSEKFAVCGGAAMLGITKLIKLSGNFELTSETGAYGIKVYRWITPFGEILLKTHPLYNFKPYLRDCITIFEPQNMRFKYIDDTHFKKDDGEKRAGYTGYDGTKEEFLTEGGYEFHFPETMMHLQGIGVDGTA